jgi:competence protein ComEA
MAPHKKYQPAYLSFTRKERWGILSLVLIILGLTCLPFIYAVFYVPKPVDHKAFENEIAELKIKEEYNNKGFTKKNDAYYDRVDYNRPVEKNDYNKISRGELFYFDPNTLSASGWIKLGVREKTASTIQNYISKGGRFNKPEDISKIWGLHQDEIIRLLPYVRIETKSETAFSYSNTQKAGKIYEKPNYTLTAIDVNNADTMAFISLPGIGSKLAARIVAFREKLGGFYKVEQVAETFALPDSTFQKIKSRLIISHVDIKKLNINIATIDELKAHPYLRYNIANAIVQYRTQHGNFSSISDIKKIMMITEEIFNKAAPYLSVK